MTAQPLVSIGMAVHNSEATLASAIQSLMNQTYTNWELLLADDGSSDNSLAIARSFNDPRIRIFTDGENRGLAKRLNELVAVARGELFARMDADDIAYPERFARQVAILTANPVVDLLGTSAIVFNGLGEPVSLMRCRQTLVEFCRRPWNGFNVLIHPT